jgi:hypothetical protein
LTVKFGSIALYGRWSLKLESASDALKIFGGARALLSKTSCLFATRRLLFAIRRRFSAQQEPRPPQFFAAEQKSDPKLQRLCR